VTKHPTLSPDSGDLPDSAFCEIWRFLKSGGFSVLAQAFTSVFRVLWLILFELNMNTERKMAIVQWQKDSFNMAYVMQMI
jgi:hypothetical protein